MLYALILETSVITAMVVYYFLNKKTNRERQKEIISSKSNLDSSTPHVSEMEQINRRKYHRVKVENIGCMIQFIDFGTNKLKPLVNKMVEANIEDISVGGMRITTCIDLPVQNQVISEITFVIKNQEFILQCEFVRKEAKFESNLIHYGIRFPGVSKNDENRLGRIINELELSKKIIS
ncbi:PilZ domain-containing protein [Bacillus oleivorans]|uniref:PilZ domain-containing protein n=1 Tax=Bacillus oleivorans TaxID=1448271 RepID=A0A285CHR1_9BACI|nr:PilZ domain-containing protein [Bacillus oleivorans]SNX67131.1 PilZ domain-containing protein [Bacillus oleivorans]